MSVQIDNDYRQVVKQIRQIEDMLMSGSLMPIEARQPLQAIIERRFEPVTFDGKLYHGRFTPPEQQVANLRLWNATAGHYFSDDQIETALAEIPEFDWLQPLVPLTLCWTMNTPWQTISAKIAIMRNVYGRDKVILSDYLQELYGENIKLVEKAPEFAPNRIWWEVIDLSANRNKAPDQVDPATAAGIQVFDAACQHPVYIRQHDGRNIPCLDVPGLRVNVPGYGPWTNSPYVDGSSDGNVLVDVYWAGHGDPSYAEPVVVRDCSDTGGASPPPISPYTSPVI